MNLPRVHAATGLVCLADPSALGSPTPCPPSPPRFDGPKGERIRIGVFVSGSDALNGFDIILTAKNAYLAPTGVDLANTVLPGTPSVILECLRGVLVMGSVCAPQDNITTLHFTVTGGLGLITTPPTTGLLFTAIYNITGVTTAGGVPITYAAGCTSSSVSGGICVTIANGSTTPDVETVQAATFDNSDSATMAAVTLSASPKSFGPEFPGSNTATITAAAVNGYPGFATDQVSFSTTQTSGLTATLSGLTCVTGGATCTTTLSLSTTTAGNYSVTVSGLYATLDPSSNPDTLVANVTLGVFVNDFGFTISPTTITTGSATITLSSVNRFAGTIALSTGIVVPPSPPLTVTFNPVSVTLSAGQTLTSTATFTAPVTATTTYHAVIKAASGTRVKNSATLSVTISPATPDFTLAASPTSVTMPAGASGTSTITVAPVAGFTGTVALSSSISPATGLSCTLTPASITLGVSQTSTLSCSGSAGSYTVTVTGTSGSLSHTATVTFTVSPSGDFSITASPTSVSVNAGVLGNSTITVTPVSGFAGDVGLTVTTNSTSLSCGLSVTPVTGGSGTSKLSCDSPVAGAYRALVTGSSGSLSHAVNVTYVVQDFAVVASPLTLTIGQGGTGTSSLTISAVQGFSGTISLGSAAPTGFSSTVSPNSLTGSGGAVLSITVSGTTTPGAYKVNVTGTSGLLAHMVTVTVTVVGKDFTIGASPSTVTDPVKTNVTSDITIVSVAGFSGTVSLSLTLPSGVSGSLNTTSVVLSSGATVVVLLTVNASRAGSFLVTVTGTSGSLAHSISVMVHAPGFDIQPSKSAFQVLVGGQASATITITGTFGFTGTVGLTAVVNATGLTCSPAPTSVTGGSGTSTLTCNGSTVANYLVTVTGSSGSVSNSTSIDVAVVDFTVTASPTTVTGLAGAALPSTVTVTPVNGFTGTVALTSSISPATGLTCTLTPASLTLGASQTSSLSCNGSAGTYAVTVTGTSGSLTRTTTVTVTVTDFTVTANPTLVTTISGVSATSTITVAPLNGFTGTVALTSPVSPAGLTCTLTPDSITLGASQTSTLSCSSTTPQNYTVTVTGKSSSLTRTAIVTFQITDFTITAANRVLIVPEGVKNYTAITVSSVNGFAGTVTLTVTIYLLTGIPRDYQPIVTLGTYTFTLNGRNQGMTVLNATAGPYDLPSDYAVNVTGTSGTLSDYAPVTVTVPRPDFSITSSPQATIVKVPGELGQANITLASLLGYNGTVALSVNVDKSGLTCSFSMASLSLLPGQSVMTMLSCHGSAGLYAVTVTGTPTEIYVPASTTHFTSVGYAIVDFTIMSNVTGILVNTSQDGFAQLNVTWTKGYANTVSLKVLPVSGLTATISPETLTGSGIAKLTVNAATAGTYTVVVNATSGSVYHTVSITVTVSVPGSSPLTADLLYAIVAVVVVAVVAGVVVVLRRRPKK